MNRRGFFGASAGAVCAAPAVAQDAVVRVGFPPYPSPMPAVGYADGPAPGDYWSNELSQAREQLARLDKNPEAVGHSRYVEESECRAIEDMRSLSNSTKARMRADVYRRHAIRDHRRDLERRIAEALKHVAGLG